jgi:ketosteroid isomerase-like protein
MPHISVPLFRSRSCVSGLLMFMCLGLPLAHARSGGVPRADRHEIRHEIDQLEQTWKEAILERNVQTMDSLLADDYIAITWNGMLQSKEQTLTDLKTGSLHFNSIDFSDRKVRFYGQTALVTSRADITGEATEGDVSGSYRFTRVYVRDGTGMWKMVSFESSRIRESDEHK